ncbi:MAG: metalloregulator ArsR/SmtB family transcription factor [Microscillaceae bacterium]|nr:metalloregulator ArsR/SmtB family transcription factor [Microscillaceae bacterium]MDW8461227.1 metalloregulator ArsR/SmtB family transcription factor [Cytophagales bacterium]
MENIQEKIPLNLVRLRIESEKLEKSAYILRAVSHPIRIAIIDLLDQCEAGMSVSDMQSKLNIEQALLSHHLGKMRDKGVLTVRREGKNMFYALKDRNIVNIVHCIQNCSNKL